MDVCWNAIIYEMCVCLCVSGNVFHSLHVTSFENARCGMHRNISIVMYTWPCITNYPFERLPFPLVKFNTYSIRRFECVAIVLSLSLSLFLYVYWMQYHPTLFDSLSFFAFTFLYLFISIKPNGDASERRTRKKLADNTPAFITLSSGFYIAKEFSIWKLQFFYMIFFRVSPFLYQFSFYFSMLLSIWVFTLSAHWILLHAIGNAILYRRLLIFDVVQFAFASRFPFFASCTRVLLSDVASIDFQFISKFFGHLFWCRKMDSDENKCKRQSNILICQSEKTDVKMETEAKKETFSILLFAMNSLEFREDRQWQTIMFVSICEMSLAFSKCQPRVIFIR